MLFINDLFWTFQGEGFYAGTRALFVRMPYCNLACSWCDTTFNMYNKVHVEELKEFALKESSRFAVVTGGEPLMHAHTPLVVSTLKELGFYVACETNGTFKPNADYDWITCSPKRDAEYKINEHLMPKVNEFKYVVDKDFDFSVLDWTKGSVPHRLSLSPEYTDMKENLANIMDYIKENPKWKISLQTHKIMGIP